MRNNAYNNYYGLVHKVYVVYYILTPVKTIYVTYVQNNFYVHKICTYNNKINNTIVYI